MEPRVYDNDDDPLKVHIVPIDKIDEMEYSMRFIDTNIV